MAAYFDKVSKQISMAFLIMRDSVIFLTAGNTMIFGP